MKTAGMKTGKAARVALALASALILVFGLRTALPPAQINILAGQATQVNLNAPLGTFRAPDPKGDLEVSGNYEKSTLNGPVTIKSEKTGSYTLYAYAFGLRTQSLTVNVLPNTLLYPGGELIGLNVYTKGVIAVKLETISTDSGTFSPALDAGVEVGDVVTKVNGVDIYSAEEFTDLVNGTSGEVTLTIVRNGTEIRLRATPIVKNGRAYIGLWVRNNVAGIGTLTYITADWRHFAALGHAITDSTSGITVPVNDGDLVGAQIINLVKGKKNAPGEIHGMLKYGEETFGSVYLNNDFGIFGVYRGGILEGDQKPLPIALQSEIHTGPATILTTIDGGPVKEYSINIDKVTRQSVPSTKGMSITVTDPQLLEKTGGIIQGMSGSPIIQDNKIVGAVTHVLLSDPKRGYGVFIEWMLQNNAQ